MKNYYDGNTAALSACRNIEITVSRLDDPIVLADVLPQLELIREEVAQMRNFINTHHPENKLPESIPTS